MAHKIDEVEEDIKAWHQQVGSDSTPKLHELAKDLGLQIMAGELQNPNELWLCDETPAMNSLVEFKPDCFNDIEFKPDVLHRVRQYIDAMDDIVQQQRKDEAAMQEYLKYRMNNRAELEQFVIEELGTLRPDWKMPAWVQWKPDAVKTLPSYITWEYPGFISVPVARRRMFNIGCDTNGPGVWSGNLDGEVGTSVEGGSDECFSIDIPVHQVRNARYIAEKIVEELDKYGY